MMPKMSEKSNSPREETPLRDAAPIPGRKVLESNDLLQGQAEVVIRHEGRFYRLRRTRLGKLILTA